MRDDFYMRLALDEAWRYQGLTYPNPAVGACVVGRHGEILALNAHQRAGEAHAEVLALRDAYVALSGDESIALTYNARELHNYLLSHHNGCFEGVCIYVTLEPCAHEGKTPACASLIGALGLKRVIIGAMDYHEKASGGAAILDHRGVHVTRGVLSDKAQHLLYPFLTWQEKNFVTFKWAQRLDGTVDGGTISSELSRCYVHGLRDVCDLLVIGGNTVRTDRPTLDARMVEGRAPDILIYSRHDDFDRSIPLFNVEGREVFIESSLERIEKYHNVLIEGGSGMFDAASSYVDCLLAFIAPKFGGGRMTFHNSSDSFETLHVRQLEGDTMLWLQRV